MKGTGRDFFLRSRARHNSFYLDESESSGARSRRELTFQAGNAMNPNAGGLGILWYALAILV